MTDAREPVAVIGVGTMGHGMAGSALRAGIPTIVWDRAPEATRDLAEQGAEVAASAADAARRAAIVVTMVPDADAVIATAHDEGMLAALAPGSIWVQMSTIGVAGIERVAALVERATPRHHAGRRARLGQQGSRRARRADDLRVGSRGGPCPRHAALRRARPQNPLGGPGRQRDTREGRQQRVAGIRRRGGRRLGRARSPVGPRHRHDGRGARSRTAVSPWQSAKLQRVVQGDFSPQFALRLALKDVRLALDAADDDRFAALSGLADEWQHAVADGLGDEDLTVVTQALVAKEL